MNNTHAFATYVALCGSRKEAARRMGVSLAMIDHILSGFRLLSVRLAMRVAADSGGHIALHELRPDIWPPIYGRKAA
jgi:DNA-binding transcriptional regulator YdaS (Cro superfamily)